MGLFDWLFRPRPRPVPVPLPPPDGNVLDRLHALHNRQRPDHLLTQNPLLMQAAQKHAEWMFRNSRMSHTGANGSSPFDRMRAEGYRYSYAGENVAYGYSTPEAVFNGWMNSTGHRRNILNVNFTEVGYGLAGTYWCVDFGRPTTDGFDFEDIELATLPGGIVCQTNQNII